MIGFLKKLLPRGERSRIFPRLKNAGFLAALSEAKVPADQMPVTSLLIGDLIAAYGIDQDDRFEMVRRDDLKRLGLDRRELHHLAVANAQDQLGNSIDFLQKEGVGRCIAGNHLTATAILLPQVWQYWAGRMTGDLAAVVPSRDCVLFCDGLSESAMRAMRRFAEEEYAQAGTHAVSMQLLGWMGNGWTIPGTTEGLVIVGSQ